MTGQGSDAEAAAQIRALNAAQAARDRARDPAYGAPGVITAGPDGAVRVQPAGKDGEYDPVHHPAHYTSHPSGVECITITEHMSFCLGSALKYLWRSKEKGSEIQDLEKAVWYIRREIDRLGKGA